MLQFRLLVLLCCDIALLFLSYITAAFILPEIGWLWDFDVQFYLFMENGLIEITLVVATIVIAMYFLGLYENIRVRSRRVLLQELMIVFGVGFFPQALLSYGKSDFVLPRWVMVYGTALSVVAVFTWRVAYSLLVTRVAGRQRIVFLGDSALARQLAAYTEEHPERGYQSIGCVDVAAESTGLAANASRWILPLPPQEDQFVAEIRKLSPDMVSVSSNLLIGEDLSRQLLKCSMEGLVVESISKLHEQLFRRVALETITVEQLVYSSEFRPRRWVVLGQEAYSRLVAAVGLLLTWPIMIVVAIAVKLDSPGPAIFRQTRLSRNGVPFQFLKFRSMTVNDPNIPPERAKENDPRITRVGRWIRLLRVDEIPQFINVLNGDMLLVGPRPEMPEFEKELNRLIPLYPQRHRVKPGITGWAQIHHTPEDSTASTARKLEYDLYYIKNMSLGLDVMIMFHTIKAVILRIGAR